MSTHISVIIPVLNGQKTLRRCLASVLVQNYDSYEVIVVDNNSTDQTKAIIEEFRSKNFRVKYVFEGHQSRGAARNRGISVATGEILMMLDCDCVAPGDWIKRMIDPILNENEQIVMGYEENLTNSFWSNRIHTLNWNYIKRNLNDQYIRILDTKNFAIKKELMKQFLFNQDIGNLEDLELSLRLQGQVQIRFLPNVRVGHYHKSTMISYLRLNFNRGSWARKIYEIHKDSEFINKEPMFESFQLETEKDVLWVLFKQFIFSSQKRQDAFFTFISDLGWRLGMHYGVKRL